MDTQKILSKALTLLLLTTMTLNTGLTTVFAETNEADPNVTVQQTESVAAVADSSNSAIETDIAPDAAETSVTDAVPSEDSDVDAAEDAASSGEVYDREALAEQAMQMMADDLAQKEGFPEFSRSLTVSPTSAFINKIAPPAVTTWTTHHVLPSITIAQAVLESGWGTSKLAVEANNLYGIKASADWTGQVYAINTAEYGDEGWYTVTANFRKYASWLDSTNDHGAFFTSSDWRKENYKNVVGETDYKKAAQALSVAGYATDPGYPAKLISIIENYNLSRFDPVPNITMNTYIENAGWSGLSMGADYSGKVSGTVGEGKNIFSFNLSIDNNASADEKGLGIEYAAHIQDIGWTNYVSEGTNLGNADQNKRVEAIKIKLIGNTNTNYNVYYRVLAANIGWTGWAKNGEPAGTEGLEYGIEAIEVFLLPNSATAPFSTAIAFQSLIEMRAIQLTYAAHSQNLGWQASVAEKQTGGQTDLRLEAFKINMSNSKYAGMLQYQAYVQDSGWQAWQMSGSTSGTTNQAKHIEAIKIQLSGLMAQYFEVYYRVYTDKFGWLNWAKDGESAGTDGLTDPIKAIEVDIVPKGSAAPGTTTMPFVDQANYAGVLYQTHVQNIGWQGAVADGVLSGTTGLSYRLEGIKINLQNSAYNGSISYRTHIESYGWQDYVADNAVSGTVGESKRLEAIEIKLSGEIAEQYDVYYRVHTQDFGWLGWTKNGRTAGTTGLAKRLESIQIKLVPKGLDAPGSTDDAYKTK